MEVFSPLPTPTGVQHNTGLSMFVSQSCSSWHTVEGDDPTHPRRWSPLWGQLHCQLFPTAQKPVTVLCLPWGAMARVPGHVPQ